MPAIKFPPYAGARVRHLQRIYNNPLFEQLAPEVFQLRLEGAIHADQQELSQFEQDLHALILDIANLESNVQSDVIIHLKEKLDQAYEQSSALGDEQDNNKRTIIQLLNVLMKAVWQGAQGDPLAAQKLREEEAARKQHYDLLEYPLIADVLNPRSVIKKDELIPVILSESIKSLAVLFPIFEQQQQLQIEKQAEQYLEKCDPQQKLSAARKNLSWIKDQLALLK